MKKVIFQNAFNLFISSLKRYHEKESTISTYIYQYEGHLKAFFADKEIEKITNRDVDYFVDMKIKKLSENYINSMISLFNSVINFVRSENLSNVNNFLQPKQLRANQKKVEIFSSFEKERLESYCYSRLDNISVSVLLTLSTGIRLGELCALQKKDFDFNDNFFKISKTMIRVKNLDKKANSKTKIIIDTPKTNASIRTIPIPIFLINIIKELFNNANSETFLTTGNRRYVTPRTIENQFKRILAECKVNYKNFHVLRHTFATYALKAGMDIKTLSEILGHSSVKITLDRYVQSDFSTKRSQMDILSNQFFLNHRTLEAAL